MKNTRKTQITVNEFKERYMGIKARVSLLKEAMKEAKKIAKAIGKDARSLASAGDDSLFGSDLTPAFKTLPDALDKLYAWDGIRFEIDGAVAACLS